MNNKVVLVHCRVCNKEFSIGGGLPWHMHKEHGGKKPGNKYLPKPNKDRCTPIWVDVVVQKALQCPKCGEDMFNIIKEPDTEDGAVSFWAVCVDMACRWRTRI